MRRHTIQRLATFRLPRASLRKPLPAPGLVPNATAQQTRQPWAAFHTSSANSIQWRKKQNPPKEPSRTDIGELDVLGNTPTPPTAIDRCLDRGFHFHSGAKVTDGSGVLLVNGEAFTWKPWMVMKEKRLVNAKGQIEIPTVAFDALDALQPRPDILILGVGPQIRPLCPETQAHIRGLGIRTEVLDTRNAAAQYNLLATERGVEQIAAALIPLGWKEGEGMAE
ncbi:unnamed protein product [Parascedosporium putredinis]|uniref:NADH dehydrogenase [ubiquinone] 1 alpha subcomplex assembly factor 3 n=1 Tax=Parascedosporium putredinis TaxID=1442378 RepID=A0A9P1HAQ8_9PEZI|nr:unnamed protein product [Parascedosporium putredinis]CAI8002975.1 unnamed protein product [Parascedosporium putredinis]